jgi:DNA-binding transcriptional LysR family regulator
MNADIGLRMLPIELPSPPRPVVAITLKDRTLSPSVELFLDCAREVAKSLTVPQALWRRRHAAERK